MEIKSISEISLLAKTKEDKVYGMIIAGENLTVQMLSAAEYARRNDAQIFEIDYNAFSVLRDDVEMNIIGNVIDDDMIYQNSIKIIQSQSKP